MCKGTFDEGIAPTPSVIRSILRCFRPADPTAYQPQIDPYHDGKPHLQPADQATQSLRKMCKGTFDEGIAPTPSVIRSILRCFRPADPTAYQPQIDPYHDGKPHLQPADQAAQSHKKLCKETECSIDIDENCAKTSEISSETSDGSTASTPSAIFRVPEYMRAADRRAHEPRIVAIGPYHHGKPHLQAAEKLKQHSVDLWLRRGTDRTKGDYLNQMKKLEPRARAAYADPLDMNSNAFVQMLLLDACFVLEFICFWTLGQQVFEGLQNTITSNRRTLTVVARDMLLLENQLPFFLLEALFNSFFPPGVAEAGKLRDWALLFVSNFSGGRTAVVGSERGNIADCNHILHLLHSRITSTRQANHAKSSTTAGSARHDRPRVNNRWIPSATQMKAAGVQLRRNQASNFLDVTFDNGKMEIPQLEVDDDTCVVLRNLIVFEQCYRSVDTDVTAYASLFTCVINTANDVALLKRHDIIAGRGNNEQVAHLFNELCKEVAIDYDNCYLFQVFHDVKKHCSRRRNHWFAEFREVYFRTPWSITALLVTTLLSMIAIAQLIFITLKFRRHH